MDLLGCISRDHLHNDILQRFCVRPPHPFGDNGKIARPEQGKRSPTKLNDGQPSKKLE